MYSNAFLSTNSAVITNHIRVKRPKRLVSGDPTMVGVDVPRNFFEFSLSRIAKTALLKSFCKKSEASFKKGNHDKCVCILKHYKTNF